MIDTQNVKIGDAHKKGQGLFANRGLSIKHPLYIIDQPALIAISTKELSDFCYNCYAASRPVDGDKSFLVQYRDARLRVCTGCRVARFCGRDCQARAWKAFHKFECKIFARLKSKGTLPESARALLRFIVQHDNDMLPRETWAEVMALEAHLADLQKSADDWMNLMLIAKACKEYSGTSVSYDAVLQLLCVLKINAMVLTTTFGDEIGVFLDPLLAKMNHSCDGGNVCIHRPAYTNHVGWLRGSSNSRALMKLVPVREIAEHEELTITYIEHTLSVQKRQRALKSQYFFECDCDRCLLDRSAETSIQRNAPQTFEMLQKWSKIVDTCQEVVKNSHSQEELASTTTTLTTMVHQMERTPGFKTSWYPYPQAIHELKLLHMKNHAAYGDALVCAFKEVLFVSREVYQLPLHPHRIIHAIYLLQLLGLTADTYHPPIDQLQKVLDQREAIQTAGFSETSITFWRLKICLNVRGKLLGSAFEDIAGILTTEQKTIGCNDDKDTERLLANETVKLQANQELRDLLGVSTEELRDAIKIWDT